ncbi:MAG: serpin family protein [Candidatus Thorarchaeota archaeon]
MSSEKLRQIMSLINSYNHFGLNVFKTLLLEGKNVFTSPIGLALTSTLLVNGTAGETKNAILKTLMIEDIESAILNELNYEIIKALNYSSLDFRLDIGISAWFNYSVNIKEDFKQIAKEFYLSEIYSLDFNNNSSISTINNWVQNKTHGKISEIITTEEISNLSNPMTFLVFNVIYFKGLWIKQFDEMNTKPEQFFLQNGERKTVQMMSQNNEFLYLKTNDVEIVQLFYGKGFIGKVSAYIFLPAESSSLTSLIQSLDNQKIMNQIESLTIHSGSLKIPRFSIESKINLTNVLTSLGLGIIFNSNADFSQMVEENSIIDDVSQKTVVVFNEKGTEIATVTEFKGIMGMPPLFSMTVNRPFLVIIMDNNIQAILYIGGVYDPN